MKHKLCSKVNTMTSISQYYKFDFFSNHIIHITSYYVLNIVPMFIDNIYNESSLFLAVDKTRLAFGLNVRAFDLTRLLKQITLTFS